MPIPIDVLKAGVLSLDFVTRFSGNVLPVLSILHAYNEEKNHHFSLLHKIILTAFDY